MYPTSRLFTAQDASYVLGRYLRHKDTIPCAERTELEALLAEAEDLDRRLIHTRVTLLERNSSYTRWAGSVTPVQLARQRLAYERVLAQLPASEKESAVAEEKVLADSFASLRPKLGSATRKLIAWLGEERSRLGEDIGEAKRRRGNRAKVRNLKDEAKRNIEETKAAEQFLAAIT